MTKTLKTLIKISKQELDIKRNNLNIIFEKVDSMNLDILEFDESLIKEQKISMQSFEGRYMFNNFAAAIKMKKQNLQAAIRVLMQQAEEIEEEIKDCFAELKKYEILLGKKEEEIKNHIENKEQLEMEEISLVQYNIKKKKN